MSHLLQTWKEVVGFRVASSLRACMPQMSTPLVSCEIKGGCQQGCVVTLEQDTISIGSMLSSDVALLDEGIPSVSAEVKLLSSPLAVVAKVKAGDTDIKLNGEVLVPGVEARPCVLPCDLELAPGVTLTLRRHRASVVKDNRPDFAIRLISLLVVAASALIVPLLIGDLLDRSRFSLMQTFTETSEGNGEAKAQAALVQELQRRLADVGLLETLQVKQDTIGTVLVSGRVRDVDMPAWQEISSWFDSVQGAPMLIAEVNQTRLLDRLPPIVMIQLSDPRRVVLANGRRIEEGREIVSGWLLDRITDGELTLANGSTRMTVPY